MDFPTNLAILQELFEDKKHKGINDASLFQNKPNVIIPSINLYNHSFHARLTADRQHRYKLKRLLADAKAGTTSYAELSEALIDNLPVLTSDH